ncbi:MAG: 3'-5' exonuclease, partial [Sneathiella sp.]
FRSTGAVLGLVDDVFSHAEARAGLTAQKSSIEHFVFREGQAGFTEIWPTVKHPEHEEQDPWEIPVDQGIKTSPAAQLSKNIAAQINRWLATKERLGSNGKKIEPRDIMILVQSRNMFFEAMVRALKQANIPVAGADRMVLTEQLAVMDLIALGKFVLQPDDDLNLAIILKSPFVGCDDNQLFSLAYKRSGSLWRALRANKPGLPIFDEGTKFLRAQLARADFVPVYEFFAEILGKSQGRKKLLARLGEEAADPIDEFLSLALGYQRTEATSLQAFLHWMEAGGAEVKRDMEQGRNEVRVLTVHGSKGLQAPIVILPDTCQASRVPGGTTIFWSDDKVPAPLWPVRTEYDESQTTKARTAIKDRQTEEKRRLLYVALTRAEDRLYICGWEGKKKRSQGCWYDLVDNAFGEEYADRLEEVELPWGDVARRRINTEAVAEPADDLGQEIQGKVSLPDWALTLPAEEPFPPQPLTPSREEEEPAVRSPIGGDEGQRYHRGILIHRLLESLPSVVENEREAVAEKWLARPAHGLSEAQQRQILTETLAVLNHSEFSEIFGPGSLAEVPLTGFFGNQIMSGQIDRLLIGPDEIQIIDYKTNRPSPTKIEDVPALYIRQMGIYRDALKLMYPEKRIKCGLLWTDGPHLMTLPEK